MVTRERIKFINMKENWIIILWHLFRYAGAACEIEAWSLDVHFWDCDWAVTLETDMWEEPIVYRF
jgi:hypothetical protein